MLITSPAVWRDHACTGFQRDFEEWWNSRRKDKLTPVTRITTPTLLRFCNELYRGSSIYLSNLFAILLCGRTRFTHQPDPVVLPAYIPRAIAIREGFPHNKNWIAMASHEEEFLAYILTCPDLIGRSRRAPKTIHELLWGKKGAKS